MEQLTLLSEEALAKISQLPETEQDFMEAVLLWQGNMSGFLMKYAQGGSCGRTLRGLFQLTEEKISESCSLKWKNAGMVWHGVRAGVPDLFLAYPTSEWNGMFIEMKREKGGTVSQAQRFMVTRLMDYGYKCVVCHGFDEAKEYYILTIHSILKRE